MIQPKKLPQPVVSLLLPRLKDEYTAFYFYRSAANWCKNVGHNKAAGYFAGESADELTHAKMIEDYLVDWNITPDLPKVDKPELEFKSLVDVIEKAYNIEYKLYEEYEDTSVKVFDGGDMCTFDFLQPLRAIQTKSVAEYSDMINLLSGVSPADKFQLLLLEDKLFS